MSQPKTILLGANGFLGRNLLRHWPSSAGELTPVRRGEAWHPAGAAAAINCIALTDLAACEKDPAQARHVNAELALEAARICQQAGVPFLQISSDGLFPNESPVPHYWRANQAAPLTEYGKSKLAGEEALRALGWGQCLRLSFVGEGYGTTRGLLTFLAQQIAKGAPSAKGFTDVWFSPLHTETLTQALAEKVLARPTGFGLEQWATHPGITKFDFLRETAARAGFPIQIEPARRQSLPSPVPIPFDQTMTSAREFALEELLEKSAASLRREVVALGGV